jgi:hypothetical protein
MWFVMAGPAPIATRAAVAVRWQRPAAAVPRRTDAPATAKIAAASPGMDPAHSLPRAGRTPPNRVP